MKKIKKYMLVCEECKNNSIHIDYIFSSILGHKLKCVSCSNLTTRWFGEAELKTMEKKDQWK